MVCWSRKHPWSCCVGACDNCFRMHFGYIDNIGWYFWFLKYPRTLRRNRMCLHPAFLSGQLHVNEVDLIDMKYAFPVDPRMIIMCWDGVLIILKVWEQARRNLWIWMWMIIAIDSMDGKVEHCNVEEIQHVLKKIGDINGWKWSKRRWWSKCKKMMW